MLNLIENHSFHSNKIPVKFYAAKVDGYEGGVGGC